MTKFVLCLTAGLVLPLNLLAQQSLVGGSDLSGLPDAPTPQLSAPAPVEVAEISSSLQADPQTPQPAPATPAPAAGQTPATPETQTPEDKHAKAERELKEEEQQRIVGIIPNFNTVNNGQAEAITPGDKFHLFIKSAFDPYPFALAGLDAGIGQAENTNPGYNQGLKGFARRYGANFADNFDGNFWGNAVLPSLLHQDPRYFRLGHGTFMHRALYSISTTFRTRGDDGKWQPAYSNIGGNFIGGAISNLYYPDGDRGLYPTLRRGLSVTYQGTIGGLLEEFYPDFAQWYHNRHARKAASQTATP